MSPREAAIEFVERFCAGDVEGLEPLLADDFRLEGPLGRFGSREEYLAALLEDPPEPARCEIVSVFEGGGEACVFYRYGEIGAGLLIAQRFVMREGRIAESLLVFDARAFGAS